MPMAAIRPIFYIHSKRTALSMETQAGEGTTLAATKLLTHFFPSAFDKAVLGRNLKRSTILAGFIFIAEKRPQPPLLITRRRFFSNLAICSLNLDVPER
jgi:hypothetical protein